MTSERQEGRRIRAWANDMTFESNYGYQFWKDRELADTMGHADKSAFMVEILVAAKPPQSKRRKERKGK